MLKFASHLSELMMIFVYFFKMGNSSVMNPIIQMGPQFGRATDDIVWHFEFSGIGRGCWRTLQIL